MHWGVPPMRNPICLAFPCRTSLWKAYREDDAALKSNVLRWFRGEYPTRKEAKEDLGIHFIVTDETWYDFQVRIHHCKSLCRSVISNCLKQKALPAAVFAHNKSEGSTALLNHLNVAEYR